jgi:hypothetical protein
MLSRDVITVPKHALPPVADVSLPGGAFGFGYVFSNGNYGISAPHWFVAVTLALSTPVALFKKNYRFSLRSFLITTTHHSSLSEYRTMHTVVSPGT